jgi:hypothetical protein
VSAFTSANIDKILALRPGVPKTSSVNGLKGGQSQDPQLDRPWCGRAPPAVVYSYAPGRGGDHAAALRPGPADGDG